MSGFDKRYLEFGDAMPKSKMLIIHGGLYQRIDGDSVQKFYNSEKVVPEDRWRYVGMLFNRDRFPARRILGSNASAIADYFGMLQTHIESINAGVRAIAGQAVGEWAVACWLNYPWNSRYMAQPDVGCFAHIVVFVLFL